MNYDTANLVMYGKANALDGLKVLGKYIRGLHAKDGEYPTDPNKLGKEVPIPSGEVDFPRIISYLKQIGFKGAITLECELAGTKKEYILKTKKYLEKFVNNSLVQVFSNRNPPKICVISYRERSYGKLCL